jgi:hypothetical protein
VLGAALILALAWPMLFTHSGMAQDWTGHLWELWQQSLNLRRDPVPGYFISAQDTVFMPLFSFYGGTLFSVGGALAILLGGATRAYVAIYLLAFAAGFGGWYWLSRSLGAGRWLALVPGTVFVTSAYHLTLVYGRGGVNEFVGVSMLPLMLAAGLSVLRADRLRPLPALALVGATLLFFGSHNITMLWGCTVVAVLALGLALAIPQARDAVSRAGLARLALLVVPAVLVNAWYLVPAVSWGDDTWVSTGNGLGTASSLYETQGLVAMRHIFTFSRGSATSGSPGLAMALPVAAILWVLGAGALVLRRRVGQASMRRALLVVVGLTVAIGVVMTRPRLVLALPHPWELVQFTYRLESYVVLGIAGAVMVLVILLRSERGAGGVARWALVPVVAICVAGGVGQVIDHPDVEPDRRDVFVPGSELAGSQLVEQRLTYSDVTLPQIDAARLPNVSFDPDSAHDGRATASVEVGPGARRALSNVAANPRLVRLDGARPVARDGAGFMVLELPDDGTAGGRHTITVRAVDPAPVVVGRALSLAGIAWLALLAAIGLAGRLRARRAATLSRSAR